ncbi:MAG: FecR domain-containing protein [Acidobacteriota bacterium]
MTVQNKKMNLILTATLGLVASSLVRADSSNVLSSPQKPAVAWSSGVLRIDGADHVGSGNLLPGSRLDTLRSAGQLYFADGSRVRLAAATRMSVQAGGMRLEQGAARIDAVASANRPLSISAGLLEVRATGGLVQRLRSNEVVVTASQSPSEVRKRNGVLVAMVRPGETLAFSLAPSAETRMVGTVSVTKGKFFLTDGTTNVVTELQANCLEPYVGKQIQVKGDLTNSGEDRRVLAVKEIGVPQGSGVENVKKEGAGCPAVVAVVLGGAASGAAAAGTAGAGTAAAGTAAAGAAGSAIGTSTAVIAGVTVAGVAATAATIAFVVESDNSISAK